MIPSTQIKRKSVFMNTRVCAIRDTSPRIKCISLQHQKLKDIGPFVPGAHFKVFIPQDKNIPPVSPDMSTGRAVWPDERTRPFVRTYTVRRIDRINGILDVEFVMHGDNGPASAWALNAVTSDCLGIGIKPGKTFKTAAWYLFAGDDTALPAIAAMLEALPAETKGVALLEVENAADIFEIKTNSAVEVNWLSREGQTADRSDLLLKTIQTVMLPNPANTTRYVWIAGEDNMVRETRRFANEQLGLNREELHATVYWKAGFSEDGYQKIRRGE